MTAPGGRVRPRQQPDLLAHLDPEPRRRDPAHPVLVPRAEVRRTQLDDHLGRPAAPARDRDGRLRRQPRDAVPRAARCVAALAGFGGGNFASSMSNITYFYPQKREGLGARPQRRRRQPRGIRRPVRRADRRSRSAPAATLNLPLAGWIWVPLILLAMFGAARVHGQPLVSAKADFAGSAAALREPHLWILSLLYIGTFGSFIGFASVFPKLIADQFPEFSASRVGGGIRLARLPRRPRRLARPPVRRPARRPLRRRARHDGRLRGDGAR